MQDYVLPASSSSTLCDVSQLDLDILRLEDDILSDLRRNMCYKGPPLATAHKALGSSIQCIPNTSGNRITQPARTVLHVL